MLKKIMASFKNRDPDSILKGIALYLLDPNHREAVGLSSCYAEIGRQIRDQNLLENDEITLLGFHDNVLHAVLVRGGKILYDPHNKRIKNEDIHFNREEKTYIAKPGADIPQKWELSIQKNITCSQFKEDYLEPLRQFLDPDDPSNEPLL